MPAWKVTNLERDVPNAAEEFGMGPGLEARFPGDRLEAEELALSLQRLAPDFRMPFGHKQRRQEEIYVVVAGSGRVKLDDEIVDVTQWDAITVGKDVVRNFEAGPDGLELLAIGAPATGPGDAEQLPGWWDG